MLIAQSCPTFCNPYSLARLLCPWDSPGKNTGVGSHYHLQGIFPIQGLNPGILHHRRILYHLCHWKSHKQYGTRKPYTGCRIFFLFGFSEETELQPLLFGLFLFLYLITFFGNHLIILTIVAGSHLHTPMYFFLSNLFFIDICFISMSIPKMLWNVRIKSKAKPMKTASASYTFWCSLSFGLLSPKCSGPLLVCSHLSALGLHSHHDPPALWPPASGMLVIRCSGLFVKWFPCIAALLLC